MGMLVMHHSASKPMPCRRRQLALPLAPERACAGGQERADGVGHEDQPPARARRARSPTALAAAARGSISRRRRRRAARRRAQPRVVRERATTSTPCAAKNSADRACAGRLEDGQVAAVHHPPSEPRGAAPRASGTRGFSSGAPPVMSTVGIAVRGERLEARLHRLAAHHLAAVGPGVDVAVAAGLVAELADVDLQHRRIRRRSGAWPAASSAASIARATGSRRSVSSWWAPARGAAGTRGSWSSRPARSHRDLRRAVPHLHAVDERRAAPDRRRHVDRLGHLIEVRPPSSGCPCCSCRCSRGTGWRGPPRGRSATSRARSARRPRRPRRTSRRTSRQLGAVLADLPELSEVVGVVVGVHVTVLPAPDRRSAPARARASAP